MKTRKFAALVSLPIALIAIASVVACTNEGGGENGGSTSSGVTPPCPNAILHTKRPYTDCKNGLITNMEEDTWCCPPQNNEVTTDSVISVTDQKCGDSASGGSGGSSNGGAGGSGGAVLAGDAGADAVPPCGETVFTNPTTVAGGVVQFTVSPVPSDCSITVSPTGITPTDWAVIGNGTNSVVIKGKNQPDPGSVSFSWSCSCKKGNGTPASGSDTVTFSS